MIDRVYQTVRMLANTEIRGNMKPADFDKALYEVMIEIYEQYPFELNKWTNRQNRGLVGQGQENIVDLVAEKMNYYFKSAPLTAVSGKFILPTDLRYLDSIIYTTANSEVSMCKDASEFNQLKRFKHTQPSKNFPIGFKTTDETNKVEKVEILPATIVDNVVANYRRNPKFPKWTYVTVLGAEQFNPDATDFSDIDMHISEFDSLVNGVCRKFGINLKEPELKSAADGEEIQKFNIENAN